MKALTMALAAASFVALGVGSVHASGSAQPHWGYSGHAGPEHWGELSPDYHACKMGQMQSPIDLSNANAVADVAVKMDYKPVALNILNNGHTVQFNVGNGSTLTTSSGKSYQLLQVHFHTPSEHVVDGKPYPLEAHLVHKSDDGALAVIGVFFAEGKENAALAGVFKHLPEQVQEPVAHEDVTMDPRALVPETPHLYRYMGSLTTPPCSEGVNWFVVKQAQEASAEQIAALTKAFGGANARPSLERNNRLVLQPTQ